MVNNKFITDSNIIDNIYNQLNIEELTDSKNVLTQLPKVITCMESEYKTLLGSTKKELVIKIIVKVLEMVNCEKEEIENIKLLLPQLIDSIVYAFNKSSKLFRNKNKKCCLPVKKK